MATTDHCNIKGLRHENEDQGVTLVGGGEGGGGEHNLGVSLNVHRFSFRIFDPTQSAANNLSAVLNLSFKKILL